MPKKKQTKDPLWLILAVILLMITIFLLSERVRFGLLIALAFGFCLLMYFRNPFASKK
jgi:hypothetical protein